MARVLITGASGFIGGFLVEKALQRGDEVWATIRKNSDRSRLTDTRIRLIELPLDHAEKMTEMLRQLGRFDWVIHNAGITKALYRDAYFEGNAGNTRRLVLALQQSGMVPDKFLFVSSLAALGPAPSDQTMVRETQIPHPLTPYGESKRSTEQFLESLENHFPWVAVQPTAVYGPWERDILSFIKLVNKGLELTIGTQVQKLSFVHAEDLAAAIFKILETPGALHRKFIVSDGKSYQTNDLGAAVRQGLGRKNTVKIKIPISVIRQIAGISETIGRWRKKPSPLNRDKIPELAASNWHCDAGPLLQELHFTPTYDLYQGMNQTIQWYKSHGWI
jgi:nucleoside-diphosphate-sugar epimerase